MIENLGQIYILWREINLQQTQSRDFGVREIGFEFGNRSSFTRSSEYDTISFKIWAFPSLRTSFWASKSPKLLFWQRRDADALADFLSFVKQFWVSKSHWAVCSSIIEEVPNCKRWKLSQQKVLQFPQLVHELPFHRHSPITTCIL